MTLPRSFVILFFMKEHGENFKAAIVGGFTLLIPFVLLSVLSILLLHIPNTAYLYWLHSRDAALYCRFLNYLCDSIWGNFALFVVMSVSWNYAAKLKMQIYRSIVFVFTAIVSLFAISGVGTDAFSREYFSNSGMFSAMVALFLTCSVFGAVTKLVDPHFPTLRVSRQFSAAMRNTIPFLAVVLLSAFIEVSVYQLTGGTLQSEVSIILTNAVESVANISPLLAAVLYETVCMALWFFGIHGQNFLYVINDGFYTSFLVNNITSLPDNIINTAFFNTFCVCGGSGAALALIVSIFLFGKNKTSKTVAKIGFLPGLFNISEIVTYGIPTVFNHILIIPFIGAPLVNLLIAYGATEFGFVPVIRQNINWAVPIFISGYVATNSINGTILQLFLFVLDIIIYTPFVRILDTYDESKFTERVRLLEAELINAEEEVRDIDLSKLPGALGETARTLTFDLHNDLSANYLYMAYQAQYDTDEEYMGAEALLRWEHETAGHIYPPMIIKLATEGGFLYELESYIFDSTCRGIKFLEQHGDISCKVSANITGISAINPYFVEMIEDAVKKNDINPNNLWIELTEQAVMNSNPAAMQRLRKTRENGHKLLIDDFGMGHTSIDYLKTDLFDGVKLDGRLTRDVLSDETNRQIISSVAQMCKDMNMILIAEYVENSEQRDKLQSLGGDAFQGYLFSKPVSLGELFELVDKRKREKEAKKAGKTDIPRSKRHR